MGLIPIFKTGVYYTKFPQSLQYGRFIGAMRGLIASRGDF